MGERFRESDQTGLARDHVSPTGGPAVAAHSADVPDRRAVAPLEMRQCQPRTKESAFENEADHRAELAETHLLERLLRPYRGIVDENVQPPKTRDRGFDRRSDGYLVGHVGEREDPLASSCLYLAHDRLSSLPCSARIADHPAPAIPKPHPHPP